jgi:serine/threonine-protein kinase
VERSTKRIYSRGGSEPPAPEPTASEKERARTMLGIGSVDAAVAEAQARAREEAAQQAAQEAQRAELGEGEETPPISVELTPGEIDPFAPTDFDPDAPTQVIVADEDDTADSQGFPPSASSLGTLQAGDALFRCARCRTVFSGREKFCPFDGEPLVVDIDFDPGDDPLIGRTVSDRYIVEGVLAEGGMGKVFRVRHARLGNVFAMKVLRRDLAEDRDVAARLIEEARATAAIGHPNIVSVSDFGEIDARLLPELGELKLPYFVMEYVAGGSLSDVLRQQGPMKPRRVASIMVQVANALAAAHAAGIIHRDLKPSNIRLSSDESGHPIAKVLDFGVAKVIGSSNKTQRGIVFGTPHYMSPEQGHGLAVDHRTDIYALGVIMYECLSGEVPFLADSYMGVVTKHLHAVVMPIDAEVFVELPLEPIMLHCLEKDAEARYPSMAALAADLEALLSTGKSGTTWHPPPAEADPALPLATRNWWPFALAAVALAGALSAWTVWHSSAKPAGAAPAPPTESAAPAEPKPPPTEEAPVSASAPTVMPEHSAPTHTTGRGTARRPPPPAAAPKSRRGSGELVDPWAK